MWNGHSENVNEGQKVKRMKFEANQFKYEINLKC